MRKIAVGLAVGFLALLITGIAYASIPSPDGVINGCRKNSTGDLRVIDSDATCPSGWTALDWRDTGPVPLAEHATTADSADTLTGLQVASSDAFLTFAAGEFNNAGVVCRPGQRATGGGAFVNPHAAPTIVLLSTWPLQDSGQAFGWQAQWRNIGATDVDAAVTVYAICAGVVTG